MSSVVKDSDSDAPVVPVFPGLIPLRLRTAEADTPASDDAGGPALIDRRQ